MPKAPFSVLIVEDHELTRAGLVFALKKAASFQVVGEADNGEMGLQMVDSLNPDIILMDIGMPVMDGVDATRKIKEQSPNRKVVILTSHQDGEEVYASLAAGADAYCMKEIKTERLVQVMEMVMEGSIWLDPAIARTIMTDLTAHPGRPPAAASGEKDITRKRYNADLTDREMEVLRLIVDGCSNKEIGDALSITIHTVKAHVTTVIQKLAVDDRTQAAVKALREGIV